MEDIEELAKESIKSGKWLKRSYLGRKENENKLKAYLLQLTNDLRTNNLDAFMYKITKMYGSLGEEIPNAEVFGKMLTNKEYFRSLGYAYVIGIEAYLGEGNKEGKGENKDEK